MISLYDLPWFPLFSRDVPRDFGGSPHFLRKGGAQNGGGEFGTRPGSGGSGDGIHGGVQGVHATAAMVD